MQIIILGLKSSISNLAFREPQEQSPSDTYALYY